MAIARSQFISATAGAVSSISALFSSAVTAGNLIVVLTSHFHAAGSAFSTVTDNVNNAGFTSRLLSTALTPDSNTYLTVHDKLNISSGAIASTYRISVNWAAGSDVSVGAMEYSGGPWTFGSTGSSNGTSSGPRGPIQTASSTPVLFVSGALVQGVSLFVSTASGGGVWITTVNNANSGGQVLNLIEGTGSSLSQQITHSLNVSTRWLAATVLYTGQTVAGGAAIGQPWQFTMLGMQ